MPVSVAEVILAAPLPQLARRFEYTIPTELENKVTRGVRVKVPLGRRKKLLEAFVVEVSESASFEGKLQDISKVVSEIPVLNADLLALAEAIAGRQAGITADVLRLAIPPRTARVEKSIAAANDTDYTTLPWQQSKRRNGNLQWVQPSIGVTELSVANQDLPSVPNWAILLAKEAIARAARDEGAIIITPDYRDLDLLAQALVSLGAQSFARLDAHQSDHVRYRNYLELLHSGVPIVIGNRSAAFAPVQNLSWIGMWDDGDPLFNEPLAPYAHTRDVVLVRQQLTGVDVTFASHARSVAMHRLIQVGWVHPAEPAKGPKVVSTEQMHHDAAPTPGGIESASITIIRTAVTTGPVLIQVARRGWATVVICADCDTPMRCTACAGPLYQPSQEHVAKCRWCQREFTGFKCAACGGTSPKFVGRGQARTGLDIARLVPNVPIVHSNGSKIVTSVDSKPKLVIATAGTEPVATGGYAAVCILDAAKMLSRESLDASEQALRAWMNAAALCAPTGSVVIQDVKSTVAAAFVTWKSELLAERELNARNTLGLPPAIRLATAVGTPEAIAQLRSRALAPGEFPGIGQVGTLTKLPEGEDGLKLRRMMLRVPYSVAAAFAQLAKALIVSNALQTHASLRIRFDLNEADD